jgi:hypothetical protein
MFNYDISLIFTSAAINQYGLFNPLNNGNENMNYSENRIPIYTIMSMLVNKEA